jgi:hypothetical protein
MTKPWWTRALLGRTAVSNPLQDDDGEARSSKRSGAAREKRLFAILALPGALVVSLEGRLIWSRSSLRTLAAEAKTAAKTSKSSMRRGIHLRSQRTAARRIGDFLRPLSRPKNVRDGEIKERSSILKAIRRFAKQLCKRSKTARLARKPTSVRSCKSRRAPSHSQAKQMSRDAVAVIRAVRGNIGSGRTRQP